MLHCAVCIVVLVSRCLRVASDMPIYHRLLKLLLTAANLLGLLDTASLASRDAWAPRHAQGGIDGIPLLGNEDITSHRL